MQGYNCVRHWISGIMREGVKSPLVYGVTMTESSYETSSSMSKTQSTSSSSWSFSNFKCASSATDASVARMTLPICIEVGEPGKSYTEASVQLGVWCCAGLLKLEELRIQQGHAGLDDGVPLLGLTAIGMDWKLHLAYKDPEDGVTVR
jgi:hypothetical protein